MAATRDYDLVLFGATGFTGELVARYLAAHTAGRRWAIAGRDSRKLQAVQSRLRAVVPECNVEILLADLEQPESLHDMARRTRVLVTTVGPYMDYGEPVLRACVQARTHYLDITGEPDFLGTAEAHYHEQARRARVRIVPCCGYDSVPQDAGAFYAVQQLPAHEEKSVRAYLWTNARPGGSTILSLIRAIEEGRVTLLRDLSRPIGKGRRLPALRGNIHHVPQLGMWAVPTPMVDGWMIAKSARDRGLYGDGFQYCQFFVNKSLALTLLIAAGAVLLVLLVKVPPIAWLAKRLITPGDGPSAEARSQTRFWTTCIAESETQRVVTRISGGDPGYDETAKTLGETALLIAEDSAELSDAFGVVSAIGVCGPLLIERLSERGLRFEVLEAASKLGSPGDSLRQARGAALELPGSLQSAVHEPRGQAHRAPE